MGYFELRVAVIGAGAMGSLLGGFLTLGDVDTVLVEKRREIIDAVRSQGITIIDGQDRLRVKVNIVDDGEDAWPADYALILVKSYHTRSAALEASKALRSDGVTVTLQNGLGNVEALADVLGYERVMAGVTTWGATLLEPGVVRLGGRGYIRVGELNGEHTKRVYNLVELLNKARLNASVSNNIMRDIWVKVAINAAINPITALTRARNGEILEDPMLLELSLKAAREAVQVARVEGIDMPSEDELDELVVNVMKATSSNTSSMLQDIINCRRTEIDAISGEIYRRGEARGLDVSVNKTLYTLVKNLESRSCRSLN